MVEKWDVQLSKNMDEKEITVIKSINNIEKIISLGVKLSAKVAEKESLVTVIKSDNNETEEKSAVKPAISPKGLRHGRITRALLTTGLNNKEPLAGISLLFY